MRENEPEQNCPSVLLRLRVSKPAIRTVAPFICLMRALWAGVRLSPSLEARARRASSIHSAGFVPRKRRDYSLTRREAFNTSTREESLLQQLQNSSYRRAFKL